MKSERLTGLKMKGKIDHIAARELFLFIQNDQQLYNQEKAIDANLRRKLKRGVFDKALAVKLFMYLADAGAKKYVRESGGNWNIQGMFNRPTRFAVAAMLTRYWIDARRDEGVHINPPLIGPRPPCAICGHRFSEHMVVGYKKNRQDKCHARVLVAPGRTVECPCHGYVAKLPFVEYKSQLSQHTGPWKCKECGGIFKTDTDAKMHKMDTGHSEFISALKNPPKLTKRQAAWIGAKIRKVIGEGRPQKQAVAMAYSMARRKGWIE